MPRRRRHPIRAGYYHVLNRASLRARIFYTREDYQVFIDLLSKTVERFNLDLLAYCVMPNHWHLVLKLQDQVLLSKSMHWLTCVHAMRWCQAHERHGPGPLYQGRFKAVPVEPDIPLLRVCRYVERNAKSANLAMRAEEWNWGSANQRLENRHGPRLMPLQFLTHVAWLRCLNEAPNDPAVSDAIRKNKGFGSETWLKSLDAARHDDE